MVKKIVIGFGIIFIVLLIYTLNEYRLFSKTYSGIHVDSIGNKNSALLIIDIQNDLTQHNGKVHVDQNQVSQINQ